MGKLLFSTSTELIRIPSDVVVYITADGNYSAINMVDKGEYVLTMQLGQIERRIAETLSPGDNVFINASSG